MEPDNITICAALKAYGYTTPESIAQVMAIDLSHAHSLLEQVEENERFGDPLEFLKPSPIQIEIMTMREPKEVIPI